jgi:hypothetical protein
MELTQRLLPGSFAGVLEVIGSTSYAEINALVSSRLAEISLDANWLTTTSKRCIEISKNYPDYTFTYGLELLNFITWLCAPLRGNNSWLLLSDEIQTKNAEIRSINQLTDLQFVSLNCWVACIPLGGIERNFPVLFNTADLDVNLRLAYASLIKHVLSHDWENGGEEMDSTSLALRLTGIVNAIDATKDLRGAFSALIIKLKGTLPNNDENLFCNGKWISELIETRNIVAHIGPSPAGLNLQDAWERSRDLDQIRQTIRLSTYLVANVIRERSLNTIPNHASAWVERIEEEFGWLGLTFSS